MARSAITETWRAAFTASVTWQRDLEGGAEVDASTTLSPRVSLRHERRSVSENWGTLAGSLMRIDRRPGMTYATKWWLMIARELSLVTGREGGTI
jgi:hypothetical protein